MQAPELAVKELERCVKVSVREREREFWLDKSPSFDPELFGVIIAMGNRRVVVVGKWPQHSCLTS